MAINIFDIPPSVVTRDLSGKSFLIYGERKSGKTSQAVRFPKPLLLGFEKGYNMLSGVIAQPINKWTEALEVKRQLLHDAADVASGQKKETSFTTVIVDTADLAYDMCESYILNKEGVEYLDETENNRGYRATSREFDSFFQDIVRVGYTLVAISHSETKQVKDKMTGGKYERTQPTIQKRGFQVLSRLVDVTAYAASERDIEGNTQMVLTLRGDQYLEAGSRNKYMSEKIPFTYEALRDDMAQAIDRLESEDGATVVDTPTTVYQPQTEQIDFFAARNLIKKYAKSFSDMGISNKYIAIIEKTLGKNRNVKDCTEDQSDLLGLILSDLQEYCIDNGILVD